MDGAVREQESIVLASQRTRHRTLYGGAAASLSLSRLAPRCWPATTVDAIVRGLPLPLLFMGAAQPLGAGMMRSLLVLSFNTLRRLPNSAPGKAAAGTSGEAKCNAWGIGCWRGAGPGNCVWGQALTSLPRRREEEEVQRRTRRERGDDLFIFCVHFVQFLHGKKHRKTEKSGSLSKFLSRLLVNFSGISDFFRLC